MMILGVYLHAICAYVTVDKVWFFQDVETGTLWDLQTLFIHVFRMPVFFVMSGFFSALLVEKRDFAGFAENRFRRLGFPLAAMYFISSAILHPLAEFGRLSGQDPLAVRKALGILKSGAWLSADPMHLWFMVVLLCFVPLSWLLQRLLRGPVGKEADRWFSGLIQGTAAPLVLSIPTFFTLVAMPMGVLDTPTALLPEPTVLAAYAVFYGAGWLFYRNRSSLDAMAHKGWLWLGAAAIVTVVYGQCVSVQLQDLNYRSAALTACIAGTGAILGWLMIFALIGLSLRYFHRTNPTIRWIADSSYWLYLAHPVALVSFQILWKQAPLPAGAKLVLTLGPSLVALWLSYAVLVRNTWLGRMLNGTPKRAIKRTAPTSVVVEGATGI